MSDDKKLKFVGSPLFRPAVIKAFVKENNDYFPIVLDDYGNEKKVMWAPFPGSQQIFLQAPEFEALYEGTKGPGKTLTMLMDFCQEVGKGYGSDWRGMIIRRTYPEFADIVTLSKKWILKMWPDAFYNEIKYFWKFPTGELLYFRPIMTTDDCDAHWGFNYTWLGWEELTLWPNADPLKRMMMAVRSTVKNIPMRVRATTNPYGKGHNWVRARYGLDTITWPQKIGSDDKGDIWKIVGPLVTGTVDENGIPEPTRRAYHGTLRENLILMRTQPQYVHQIRAGAKNKAQLDAYLYGLWDISAGGMFDDIWHSYRHIICLKDFDIPLNWRMYRAYDHGSSKPWSCGWYAESNGEDLTLSDGTTIATIKGDLFRVGELYGWQTGQADVGRQQPINEIKKEILEYEIARGWRDQNTNKTRVRRGPADTSIFSSEDGKVSVADDFESPITINGHRWRGIIWERADKGSGSREQGWEQIRKRLKATKRTPGGIREEKGLFIVEPRCPQWIRTVPKLPRDEKNPDDVDTETEDHIGDETRYMLRFETGPGFSTRRI